MNFNSRESGFFRIKYENLLYKNVQYYDLTYTKNYDFIHLVPKTGQFTTTISKNYDVSKN